MFKLCCVKLEGAGISDEVNTILYQAACRLSREGRTQVSFKTDECEGQVRNERKCWSVGGIIGAVFTAEVDEDATSSKVTFIVTDLDGDLYDREELEWGTDSSPCEQAVHENVLN